MHPKDLSRNTLMISSFVQVIKSIKFFKEYLKVFVCSLNFCSFLLLGYLRLKFIGLESCKSMITISWTYTQFNIGARAKWNSLRSWLYDLLYRFFGPNTLLWWSYIPNPWKWSQYNFGTGINNLRLRQT